MIVLKKFLAALIVGNLFFMPNADAEIKIYTATGEESASEFEAQEVVKLRALDKAIKLAAESAGADFKTSELTAEELSAIIADTYELGEVNYNFADKIWRATVEIKFDDAEIKNYLARDDNERLTLIRHNKEIQKLSEVNDRKIENLRKRAENVSKREDKKFFKAEFEYFGNEFLSNQKVAQGNRFAYQGRSDDAIKLYTEAAELNEYNAAAYNLRGNIYNLLALNQQNIPIAESYRRQALADFDRAIRLNSSYASAYVNRGLTYYGAKNFSAAIKDFNRAINLESDDAQNYFYRALCYRQTDKEAAFADFNKAIELNPNAAYVYSERGNFYEDLQDFSKAVEDYTRAIELTTQKNSLALCYQNRGNAYRKLNVFGKAVEDYSRAIELMETNTQKNPLLPWIYRSRGECYQSIGDGAKAQADFKRFAELQRR